MREVPKIERTCERCGQVFLGGHNAKFCGPCGIERKRESARRSEEKKKAKRMAALDGDPGGQGTGEGHKRDPNRPNTEQCKGCIHKGTCALLPCCEYLINTGHCRERDGDRCLSKQTKGEKPNLSPWGAGVTGGNTLAGYKR